jgi:hypothetical protein
MLFFYEKMIKKKGYKQLVFTLMGIAIIFALNFVSAEVVFSQLNPVYSLGEDFSSEIQLSENVVGYMDVNLICDNAFQNLYRGVPEAKTIVMKRKLIPIYIGNLSGSCYLESLYGEQKSKSQTFKISKDIRIQLSTTQKDYEAGNIIKIKGSASKESGNPVGQIQSGFIGLFLNDEIKTSDIVRAGQFDVNLAIPETLKKGEYNLMIKVFEKDSSGTVLSSNEIAYSIKVLQKPGKLDIATDIISLVPGENITLIPFLYDKAGEEMESKLLLQSKDSQGDILFQGLIDANQKFVLETKTNTPRGSATIVIQKENLSNDKIIEIKELKKVVGEIKNQTLYLRNVGNVPYTQMLEVKIGGETLLKEISIGLNESKAYDLYAPDGSYNVQINDDSQTILDAGGVSMTGEAISMEEARVRTVNFVNQYPIIWIFILLVIIGFAFASFKKYQKTKFLGAFHEHKPLRSFSEDKGFRLILPSKEGKKNQEDRQEKYVPVSQASKPSQKFTTVVEKDLKTNQNIEKIRVQGEIREAEQAGVLHGTKQRCSVIAIRFKSQVPREMGKENLMKALEIAYKQKAVSYMSGDYCLIIFAPTLTRTYKNEETAIKVAQELEKELHSHNRLFKEKVPFGIGVNSGELIVKTDGNILKFATIEKTIPLAKKIAEISGGEVLLSQDIHSKTMNSVKADKNEIPGQPLETFKIKRIVDQNVAEKFIKDFMRRN